MLAEALDWDSSIMHLPGNRGLDNFLLGVGFNDNSVLAQLLLHKNHLLRSIDNEVTAGIQRAFVENAHLSRGLVRQHTLRTAEHDRHSSDGNASSDNPLATTDILKVD